VVELLSHDFILEQLDSTAPFGAVFSCSMLEAREAVERALNQLGLLHLAKRYWRCFRNSTSNDGAQVLPLSLDSTAYSRTALC
jgi:hypothetical protein